MRITALILLPLAIVVDMLSTDFPHYQHWWQWLGFLMFAGAMGFLWVVSLRRTT